MPVDESARFEMLISLIRQVKPSLEESPMGREDSLVDHLGLDSLDILQLARKARRTFGASFDVQAWAGNRAHRYSIQSLLDATLEATPVNGETDTVSAAAPV
jgi:acyl carrier protein